MNIIKSNFVSYSQLTSFGSALSKQMLPICVGLLACAQTALASKQENNNNESYGPALWLTFGLGALTLLAMRFLGTSDTRPMEYFEGNFIEAAHLGQKTTCIERDTIVLPTSPTVRDLIHRVAYLRDLKPEAVTIRIGGKLSTHGTEGGVQLKGYDLDKQLSTFGEQMIQVHVRFNPRYLTDRFSHKALRNPMKLPSFYFRGGRKLNLGNLTLDSSVRTLFTTLARELNTFSKDIVLAVNDRLIFGSRLLSASGQETAHTLFSKLQVDVRTAQVSVFKKADVRQH